MSVLEYVYTLGEPVAKQFKAWPLNLNCKFLSVMFYFYSTVSLLNVSDTSPCTDH